MTRTGPASAPTVSPLPTSARARDWPCLPARTVPSAGGLDWSPSAAGDGDPPPTPARAQGLAIPPRPDGADSRWLGLEPKRGRRRRPRRPHRTGPGTGNATPPGRCPDRDRTATERTRIRAGRRGRAASASRPLRTGAGRGGTSQPFSRRGHPGSSAGGGRRVKVTFPPTPCTR